MCARFESNWLFDLFKTLDVDHRIRSMAKKTCICTTRPELAFNKGTMVQSKVLTVCPGSSDQFYIVTI